MSPIDKLPVETLINQALAGNQNALADLFAHYRLRLRRMVDLRMHPGVRGRLDASDVVQESFVEVARKIAAGKHNTDMPFFLWMRLTTGDMLAQFHRKHLGAEMRNANREVSLNNQRGPEASSPYLAEQLAGQFTSVDRRLIREEIAAKLETAINSMDPTDREVIAMRHFEELTTDEIAILLGMTASGVLKRYGRAIRRLNKTIGSASSINLEN